MGCRVVPTRRRSTPPPTHHGERGLNLNNVGFLGGEVIVAGYREICEVLFPQPVTVDEVLLRHVIIPLYLQLISPPKRLAGDAAHRGVKRAISHEIQLTRSLKPPSLMRTTPVAPLKESPAGTYVAPTSLG
jgi:hypothetical protein